MDGMEWNGMDNGMDEWNGNEWNGGMEWNIHGPKNGMDPLENHGERNRFSVVDRAMAFAGLTCVTDTHLLDTVGSRALAQIRDIDVTAERSAWAIPRRASMAEPYGGTYLDLDARILQRLTSPRATCKCFRGSRPDSLTECALCLCNTACVVPDRRVTSAPEEGCHGASDATAPRISTAHFELNLDDLTSRQQTGLTGRERITGPRASNLELGARVRTEPLTLEIWAFAPDRRSRRQETDGDRRLPPIRPVRISWFRYQLRNAVGMPRSWGSS